MAVIGVKGPSGKVVEKLFQKVIELVKQDADTNIIWLEDTGTIPFQSLALSYGADDQILSRIQYIRVFDLEGYIDSFKEIKCKSVLVLSHFGAMCKDRVYQDETPRGNALVNEIMLKLRQLSHEQDVTSYIVGCEGLIEYYLDDVLYT